MFAEVSSTTAIKGGTRNRESRIRTLKKTLGSKARIKTDVYIVILLFP